MSSLLPAWAWILIAIAALLGIGGGAFFLMSSAGGLARVVEFVFVQIWNALVPQLLKRKTPEEEAKDRQVEREGGPRKDGGR